METKLVSRGTSLLVICYKAQRKRLSGGGRRSTFADNIAPLPSFVIDLRCCPLSDVWWETVLLNVTCRDLEES